MTSHLFYRLDLDKTYLATPLEDRLKLLKVPFEAPEDKRTLPGMASLVRSLREHGIYGPDQTHITILSASPTFMADRLRAKLELDGAHVDEFVLKDQWSLVKKRRFREIADPFAYKLHALLRKGAELSRHETEILVGDDWDKDPLIYTLYAASRAGQVPDEILERLFEVHDVRPAVRQELEEGIEQVAGKPTVEHIFIRRERRRGDQFYDAFGPLLTAYDDAFQLILLLYDAGLVEEDAVWSVASELKGRRWRNSAFAFSWRSLVDEHHLVRYGEVQRLMEQLDVIPRRRWWERLFQSPFAPSRDKPEATDWDAILAAYELTNQDWW